MALSEYEKHVLEQMEAELRRGDPELVTNMRIPYTAAESPERPQGDREEVATGGLSPRKLAIGVLLVVVGLCVLIGAVSLGYSVVSIVMGVAGFAVMFGGVLYALAPTRRRSRQAAGEDLREASSGKKRAKKVREQSAWEKFLADQERRWDERHSDD
ncbi:DUF3040 domain-containing protein [Schaalia sp. ZJ1691]|uniref:DUF3040 domain-containing protein n=1 Tax=Schaalia sp. ZJ1691 TaxID=2709404 RepID=UPI0013EE04FE|nr:DUF3040 domain-containing protein [Schaalia sp. ZJ1691]